MTLEIAADLKRDLIHKLNAGLFVPEEWQTAIQQIESAGFVNMADSLQERREHYCKAWEKA